MAQTEIDEILNTIKSENALNSEMYNNTLAEINTKLDDIANDGITTELIKGNLKDLEASLESRHRFISEKFSELREAFENLNNNQELFTKNADFKIMFNILNEHIDNFAQEIDDQRDFIKNIETKLDDFRNDNSKKDEILSNISVVKDGVDAITKGLEASIMDVNSTLRGITKTLMTMDVTDQNDIIKRELENMLKNDRETYDNFFKTFGMQLKFGIYADFGANKDELKDLIMFYSSTEKKLVTLDEYVSRMKEGQECIYYACGESNDKVDNMPQVELIKDKGYENGPSEFLYCVHHAQMILTDSFHAAVFSIIFHKAFSVFSRLDQNYKNAGLDSRLDTLLSKLKIENHKYNTGNGLCFDTDYVFSDEIIDIEKKKTEHFIQVSINNLYVDGAQES